MCIRDSSKALAEQPGPELVVMAEYVGIPKFAHIGGKTWKGTAEGDPNYGVR